MKLSFKRGEKGFTLVELVVVMGIIAILASIVVPSVTGTKQVSIDSQVKQDASVLETAVGNYNADSSVAESLTSDNTTMVTGEPANQSVSSKWPELMITAAYATEFPEDKGTEENTVSAVTILSDNGTILYATGGATGATLGDFVTAYNAVDVDTLIDEGYQSEEPNGKDMRFSTVKPYHAYLWLLKKVAIGSVAGGGRGVDIFRLITIEADDTDALTYQQIY